MSLGVTYSLCHRLSLIHQRVEGDVILGKGEVVGVLRQHHCHVTVLTSYLEASKCSTLCFIE